MTKLTNCHIPKNESDYSIVKCVFLLSHEWWIPLIKFMLGFATM